MTDLKNKKCFITGAASGIGRATAIAAAQQGARLFLTDIRAEPLEALAQEIRDAGGTVAMLRSLNIADIAAVRAYAQDIHAAHGSMDIVMNIAGISIWGEVEHLRHEDWRNCIEINLMGPIHVIECFLPPMIAAGRGGHLVNVSSAAGLFALPWHAAYSASKFGLRGISEVLRFDLARHRIGVSLVCPGAVNTGLVRTIEIRGVDMQHPRMVAMRERFARHAITPEKAAAAIIEGVRRNRYMVYTSLDIRVGYWLQRKFAWPYEIVMRLLNNQLSALGRGARP